MKGREHLILGTVVGASVAAATRNYDNGLIFMSACIVGSLSPDIDLPDSKLGHLIKPISALLNKIFGHRGFIHTPLNAAVLTLIYWLITRAIEPIAFRTVALGFLVGFTVHLIQDTFTKGGIMWLYPVKLKIHFTNIGSDSFLCFFITIALAIGWMVLLHNIPEIGAWLIS